PSHHHYVQVAWRLRVGVSNAHGSRIGSDGIAVLLNEGLTCREPWYGQQPGKKRNHPKNPSHGCTIGSPRRYETRQTTNSFHYSLRKCHAKRAVESCCAALKHPTPCGFVDPFSKLHQSAGSCYCLRVDEIFRDPQDTFRRGQTRPCRETRCPV